MGTDRRVQESGQYPFFFSDAEKFFQGPEPFSSFDASTHQVTRNADALLSKRSEAVIYRKNLYTWEQALRLVASAGVAGLALFGMQGGLLAYAIIAGAVGFAITGIFGWCPMCAMVGRKLKTEGE